MAARRPSKISIRARQRNILEGMGTADDRYKQAAKRFGVTPRQLKTFVTTKPAQMRTDFNRSPAYKKLYGTAKTAPEQRKQVRETFEVTRIKRYKIREADIRRLKLQRLSEKELRNRTQIGELVQNLYSQGSYDKYKWANYVHDKHLPTSIDTIKLLHRNGNISDKAYIAAVKQWRAIYNVSAARASLYEDEVEDYEGEFDEEAEEA